MTDAKKILWEKISKRKLDGLRFRKQHSICRYVVDFYCFEKKPVIELDGDIHDSRKEYDHNRDNELTARGNTILRFKNEAIFNNIDYVLSKIVGTCKNIAETPNPTKFEFPKSKSPLTPKGGLKSVQSNIL